MKKQHKRFIKVNEEKKIYYAKNSINMFSNNNNYFSGIKIKSENFKKYHLDLSLQVYSISKMLEHFNIKKLDLMSKYFYIKAFS